MQIFCVEQNYYKHKNEIGSIKNVEPIFYLKDVSALWQYENPFCYPSFSNELYCGCELVLRVSKSGENILPELAVNFYDALTVGINFIALNDEPHEADENIFWQKIKGWQNSSVTGKWLPASNFSSKSHIEFCLYKNREMVQICNSSFLINDFNLIIAAISNSYFLKEGDLIFTGTQLNIGELFRGDKLEAFIEDESLLEFEIE